MVQRLPLASVGLVALTCLFVGIAPRDAQTQEPKSGSPEVVLADTFNAVTKIYFMNVAVHNGSPNPEES